MEAAIPLPEQKTAGKNNTGALEAEISKAISGKTLLVGIGNFLRGDDRAGPALIEAIAGKVSVECINAGSVPENYLEKIVALEPKTIFFIDAANFYGVPGEIRLFGPEAVCSGICFTHTGSIGLIIAYLRSRIPSVQCIIIGIQSQALQLNASISRKVELAVDTLASIFTRIFPHA